MKKTIVGMLAIVALNAWSQDRGCSDLIGFVHASATGWASQSPKDLRPLSGVDLCMLSSAADHSTLCVKQDSNIDAARLTASVWLKELNSCLKVKPTASALKKIVVGAAIHEIMEFDPLVYRGLPLKMNLRMQYNASGGGVLVNWLLAPQPTKEEDSELNICPMIRELLDPVALRNNWQSWQGPLLEKSSDFSQYICAKVPHQAASRYDCDFRVSDETTILSTRWVYGLSTTDSIGSKALEVAKKIAACDVGMDWTQGKTRHVIDSPRNQVRIDIVSNKNDVGRGPSVTMNIQHWKHISR